jgi:hypothetical protein
MLQMRRSRGAVSGFLLILLGLWGALIPFVGPYFHYAYTPDVAWHYNTARLWLEVLPAVFGGLLAAAAGAWFVLGTTLSPLWNNNVTIGGSPASSRVFIRVMEQIGFFYALGVVIVLIAGAAVGRILSVPSGIREVEAVPPAETAPAETAADEAVPAQPAATEALPRRTVPGDTQTIS